MRRFPAWSALSFRPLRPFALLLAAVALAACSATGSSRPAPAPAPVPAGPAVTPPPVDDGGRDRSVFLRPPHLAEAEPVRVALLLPLSGPAAEVGNAMLDAAQLALFEFDDPSILLIPKDTGGDSYKAMQAAEAALAEGAEIILGPLFAASVRNVAVPARAAGVPVIAFSTDATVAGEGVYLLSFLPEQDVERVVDFAVLEGRHGFAALVPQNEYGARVRDALAQAVAARGAELVAVETYPPSADGMLPPAERLAQQRERFDTVMLPAGGQELRTLAPLLPYFDVDPRETKLIGTGLWDDPSILSEPNLVGGWFAAPPPETRQAFTQRFQQAFGRKPHRIASLAYDATSLAIALSDGLPGARYPAAELTAEDGFAGIDGVFRFLRDGRNERALAVMEVRPGGFVVVSPAPRRLVTGPVF